MVLLLAWLSAVGGFVVAQADLANFLANFSEPGRATWEMAEGGLQAAHPTLPIGSTPTVRSTATGREIPVTVTGRIPASTERVIDISADAAWAIGLELGSDEVLIYFPPPAVVAMAPPEQSLPHGINITIYNHVIPHSVWLQRQAPVEILPEPALEPLVRVLPYWPDPYSDRIYRLQVGSWPLTQDAFDAFLQLRAANFNTIKEYSHGMHRVYAANVHASEVYYSAHRLGEMGFTVIYAWVQ